MKFIVKWVKPLAGVLVLILLMFGAGCAVVAAGGATAGGTYVYIKGELKRTFEADLQETWIAANQACRKLELHVDQRYKDALSAEIDGLMSTGDQFVIKLEPEHEQFVTVLVRVGIVGNQKTSETILEAIHQNLIYNRKTSQK